MIKYGLFFEKNVSEAQVELLAYRTTFDTGFPKSFHLERAAKILFPEKLADGRKGFIWTPWTTRRIVAWCAMHSGQMDMWWGPSATGKTTDCALILLLHWLSDPQNTTINVVTTSLKMLKLKIFGEIAKLYMLHDGNLPGELKTSIPAIVLGDENTKNGIFGHAVEEGKTEQAINKIIGLHNEYNVLVVDEMQGAQMAAPEAFANLSIGRESKFLGMCNPQSRLGPEGKYSEPLHGWDSINPSMESWETKFGICHFFDGRKSPGVEDPERYFFLLKQSDIDRTRKSDGENSLTFWSQRIGFMPPEGMLNTVMSEAFIDRFSMRGKATWKYSREICFGLDPAYAAGGDRCILYPAMFGMMDNGIWGIEFMKPIRIELAQSADELMAYFIARRVKEECLNLGGRPDCLAMDCTGTQGSIADVIEKEWGRGLLRVQFGGKPSQLQIEQGNPETAEDRYTNRVTELWYTLRTFGGAGQVRGLTDETCVELSQRMTSLVKTRTCIESKTDMKGRTGHSPDLADAAVCVMAYVRERLSIIPGVFTESAAQSKELDELIQTFDVDGNPQNYLQAHP